MRTAAAIVGLVLLLAAALFAVGRRMMAAREPGSLEEAQVSIPGRMIRVGGRRVHVVERGAGAPLLLVHGMAGTTLAHAGSRIVAIPAAGHFAMNDQPERFVEEVERFLTDSPAT